MDTNLISHHFARIGAELKIEVVEGSRPRRMGSINTSDYLLNIEERNKSERFILSIRREAMNAYDFLAVDMRPDERHLLLLARRLDNDEKRKFLCGHDERHWFVAGVPDRRGVTGVPQAMEALKPGLASWSQSVHGVKPKNLHRRHNEGFIRQGEWFFIPTHEQEFWNPELILRHEPLRRGSGKPHIVEELVRTGGETVYVSRQYPRGVSTERYEWLIKNRPKTARGGWRIMRRDPTVYVRGAVRHPDHRTITLPFWHRVALSNEWNDGKIAFLD